jgi:hypothetical protein
LVEVGHAAVDVSADPGIVGVAGIADGHKIDGEGIASAAEGVGMKGVKLSPSANA